MDVYEFEEIKDILKQEYWECRIIYLSEYSDYVEYQKAGFLGLKKVEKFRIQKDSFLWSEGSLSGTRCVLGKPHPYKRNFHICLNEEHKILFVR